MLFAGVIYNPRLDRVSLAWGPATRGPGEMRWRGGLGGRRLSMAGGAVDRRLCTRPAMAMATAGNPTPRLLLRTRNQGRDHVHQYHKQRSQKNPRSTIPPCKAKRQ